MTVSDAIGLGGYLTDPWLAENTGLAPLMRDPERVRAATLRYLEAQSPGWRTLVSQRAGELPSLPENTKLVVFLVSGNEETLIEPCLNALSDDLRSSELRDESEIIVVRQWLAGQPTDATSELVRRWARTRTPATRLIDVEWPADCTTFLSLSRKLAVDVALHRLAAVPRRTACHFLTEDADVEWVERGRARSFVHALDTRPRLDALRGWHLRSLDLLEYLPLFVERVTWRAVEHALSDPRLRPERGRGYNFVRNRVVTAGWNTAFTQEAYVLAGGYTPTVELFEDNDLGQRISIMRGGPAADGFRPNTTTIEWLPVEACSDGRRALASLISGAHLYGGAPSLDGFVDATGVSRAWSMREATEAARAAAPDGMVEAVLDRRRQEIERFTSDPAASELVIRTAWRELTGTLKDRQREFLAAARAVRDGSPSRAFSRVLRHTAA